MVVTHLINLITANGGIAVPFKFEKHSPCTYEN